MVILNQSDFDNVKNGIVFNEIASPTFSFSVLEGYIDGTVYADSKVPETVLIETNSGIYYIVGETNNDDFNDFLFDLYRQRKKENLRFTLFSSTENWDTVIKLNLKNEVKHMSRFSFIYEHNQEATIKDLPSNEYSISEITKEVILNSVEFNDEYYKEYWGSSSNFIEKGFGYCILHNGKVVSECTSIFSSQKYAEIDIATHKDYRGKGLASIVAKTFIEHSLKNHIIPSWDCDVSNKSSIKLAGKLGFGHPKRYSVFV
ncbi:GNAT family N-acetyltransferase [Bacillus weihaiensis]|uniref:Acetyltransferase n=1 Tax=Bacillus weihaiensis TaxID=1547283 RepID=A0A1L3MRM5_9BACI|nr:GNAT family N-acetyltransferase [Bacillus weihaiensis]APH04988.1 acetyltransferase [Bacillus weihaiensis]